MKLVLLGTAGSAETAVRPTKPRSAAHGISSALVVGGRIYVVDAGQSSARQLVLADPLGHGPYTHADLAAFFLTHLHCDHTMDLANYPLTGFLHGWPDGSVPVFGPWPRRIATSDGGSVRAPGTAELVDRLLHAFDADSLDRETAAGSPSLSSRMHGVDLTPPDEANRDALVHTDVRPWTVYEDERVRVSATLVDHRPMYPALAFRFDTDAACVVFSGDTGPSDNLVALADGADVLVHEVIDPRVAVRMFGEPPHTDQQRRVIDLVLAKHTSAAVVGSIAQRAGVRTLVLSHLVPGDVPASDWAASVSGFAGRVIVGEDLAVIDV